jgi:hypothetical protein
MTTGVRNIGSAVENDKARRVASLVVIAGEIY